MFGLDGWDVEVMYYFQQLLQLQLLPYYKFLSGDTNDFVMRAYHYNDAGLS